MLHPFSLTVPFTLKDRDPLLDANKLFFASLAGVSPSPPSINHV
jgi:hypothetical protein